MGLTASLHDRTVKPSGRGGYREVMHEVNLISHKLKLPPDVRRRAATICAEAKAVAFGHGVPHEVFAAAALYVACRENKIPVTLREFANTSASDPREVGRCYLQLLDSVHISRPGLNGRGYVHHLALKRALPEQAFQISQDIINSMSVKGLGGKNPMTLAAAALYLACCSIGENVTQSEVAEAAGVGEESVRECCKEIRALTKPAAQPSEGGKA